MIRDMELVRVLLTEIAEGNYTKVSFELPLTGERSEQPTEDEKIAYHLEIMRQAGLIEYKEQLYNRGMRITQLPKLTWLGQDYYGAINNDSIWSKTKQTITKKGFELGNVPFEILILAAKMKAKEMLGLPIE